MELRKVLDKLKWIPEELKQLCKEKCYNLYINLMYWSDWTNYTDKAKEMEEQSIKLWKWEEI